MPAEVNTLLQKSLTLRRSLMLQGSLLQQLIYGARNSRTAWWALYKFK